MSVCVGEEFISISEEGSDKEKPEMKVDNPNLRTNVFQEEWCVGKNSEGQGVTSTEGNELSPEVDHNADDIVEGESVSYVSQQENLSARKVKGKVVLRKDDKVAFRESDIDQWKEATVLSRGGKATGKFPGYFNVQMNDSSKNLRCINFDDLKEWKKVDIFSSVEQVNVVIVPKQMYEDKEVVKAKLKQLADWKTFDDYDEVKDLGQEKITGTWVVVKKGIDGKKGIKARWVAKEFQEEREIKVDCPTVSKLGIRALFAIAVSKEWLLEVTDVKSAFLQGDELDRELYMESPAEEKKPNAIWRLNKAVYGLNDAPLK